MVANMRTVTISLTASVLLAAATLAACGPTRSRRLTDDEIDSFVGARTTTVETVGAVSRVDLTNADSYHQLGDLLLSGRVPGVVATRAGSGRISVRVRGSHSMIASDEPLYVLDGIPFSREQADHMLTALNPRDVGRIDVLKDAGATSLYGARGASGVILITTKRSY